MRLLLLLTAPLIALSQGLEACYRVYVLFLPVAESCVKYELAQEKLTVSSWVKTVNVGRFVRRVHNWGKVELVNFKPVYFELFQREGDYERDHYYHFTGKGVRYNIIKFPDDEEREEITTGFFPSPITLYDPFSASLILYLDTPNRKGANLSMFYDEKLQYIFYKTVGSEQIKVGDMEFRTWKVLLIPHIVTEGTLKPRGKWLLWIDQSTLIPVLLKVNFNVGSVKANITYMRGKRNLLRSLKDSNPFH